MTEPIDIHDEITSICSKLGLEPENVSEIIFQPTTVKVTKFHLDADGKKHLLIGGEVAQSSFIVRVHT